MVAALLGVRICFSFFATVSLLRFFWQAKPKSRAPNPHWKDSKQFWRAIVCSLLVHVFFFLFFVRFLSLNRVGFAFPLTDVGLVTNSAKDLSGVSGRPTVVLQQEVAFTWVSHESGGG